MINTASTHPQLQLVDRGSCVAIRVIRVDAAGVVDDQGGQSFRFVACDRGRAAAVRLDTNHVAVLRLSVRPGTQVEVS